MTSFTIALICVQACLLQNVYSQCLGAARPGLGLGYGLAEPFAAPGWGLGIAGPGCGLAAPAIALEAYGGSGIGEVAVAGEMGVGGTTLAAGQVPVLGAVEFGGVVPAAGAVSMAGNCACGGQVLPGPYNGLDYGLVEPFAAPGLAVPGCGLGIAGPGYGPAAPGFGLGIAGPGYGLAAPAIGLGAYGGSGIGEVAVAGEMGVAGTTLVAGQVPILGAVEFGGVLPAGGAVSMAGNCACGCRGFPGPYVY